MIAHLSVILKPEQSYKPIGTTYALISSLIVFLLFEEYIAVAALFFMSIGDSLAGEIGEHFGRHGIFKKSLEGSLACLVTCLIIAVVMSVVWPVIPVPAAMLGAVSATIVELLPVPIDDNLTVPVISAGIMMLVALAMG